MSVDLSGPAAARRHRHTPRVRRLAAQVGVDPSAVTGTGPSGRVTTDDVRRAGHAVDAEPTGAEPTRAEPTRAEPTRAEPAPAARVDGPGSAAPVTSVVEVDVTAALAGAVPLVARLASATVEALRAVPQVDGSAARPFDLAVVAEGGTTLLPDAGGLSLDGIARRLSQGDATPGPATFTLVDASHRGTLWESSPLPDGQVAVLTVGAVADRPCVLHRPDGERAVAVRAVVHLALHYDARRLGAEAAARFLTTVRDGVARAAR